MNLSIPNHIKVKHIERKYYKKYFYKICFEIDKSQIKQSFKGYIGHDYARTISIRSMQNVLLKSIKENINIEDYRIRSEYYNVTIFTNDENTVQTLIDQLADRIVEIHCPLTQAHKEAIDESRRIRVRKTLFEDKFKFKVYLNFSWKLREQHYLDIKDWVNSMENPNGTRWAVNKCLTKHFNYDTKYRHSIGYTAAIYLNDAEDLMMCQMKFHDQIHYIEEAVLLEDL
jgi:hypothetical protein